MAEIVIEITSEQLKTLYNTGKVVFGDYYTSYKIVVSEWDQADSLTTECRILAVLRMDSPLNRTNYQAIPAIKKIREVTGLGLKEAKDVFDEWKDRDFCGNIRLSRMPLGGN